MTRFNRFKSLSTLCAILLCYTHSAVADELQEATRLAKQGQNSAALTKVESFLGQHPKDAEARLLKGVLLNEQGRGEDALRIFTALTVDYPKLPEAYNNLAVIYAAQGQYDKAKNALESALRTNASYATAYENLSEIYAKMASLAYDKALQLDRGSNNTSPARLTALTAITSVAGKPDTTPMQVARLDKAAATTAKTERAATPSKAEVAPPAQTAATEPTKAVATGPAAASSPKASPDNQADILKAVHDWAKAWSARNAGKYLSMYARDFNTPGNMSRSQWEQQRRERIAKPQPISVTIINPKVSIKDENNARVSFVQSYRSGSLKSTTRKTLVMTRTNDSWLIQAELSGV